MSAESSEPVARRSSLTPSRRIVLSGSVAAAGGAVLTALPAGAEAAEIRPGAPAPRWPGAPLGPPPPAPHCRGEPLRPQLPDPDLRAILREIDPERVRATVLRLVSFGTRPTLSS